MRTLRHDRFYAKWIVLVHAFVPWPSAPSPDKHAAAVKRLYVEPFTTKTAPEKLRADVIAELRKLKSLSLVSSESDADAILGGGGEIWIKGYRSLNPRSGTVALRRHAGVWRLSLRRAERYQGRDVCGRTW